MNLKTALVILALPLFIASFAVGFQSVKADSSSPIVYSGGVTIYSPVNTTYDSNFLTLNLSFAEGLPCSLKYYIDGTYEGAIPLVANPSVGFQMITYEAGLVQLPQLSEGSHCLTIYEECDLNGYGGALPPGAPFKETAQGSHDYVAIWVDAINFTINSNADRVDSTPPTTPPNITNLSIENQTYNTIIIPLNFTVEKSISQYAYSLDGKGNVTIFGNSTLTNLSVGTHKVTVYAWDDYGNIGASKTVNFTVVNASTVVLQKSEPFPTGLIIAALIASLVAVILTILVYVKWIK